MGPEPEEDANMKNPFKRMKSYTLVELMVVVVIISVIAGIAIPQYLQTMDMSRARDARITLKLVQHGERVYRSEKGGYLPIAENALDNYWEDLKLENPNVLYVNSGFKFSVEGTTSAFTGKARRTKDNAAYTINEAGQITATGNLPQDNF